MDYLRTLGSAAVSSLVQKSGLNLPFSLGPKVASFENKSIWTLYDATKRDDGSSVSVFEFDSSLPRNRNTLPLAKNALRKLRTIRHPDILKYLDAVETDTTIHIMTESVRPLGPAIQENSSKSAQEKEDWLLWGLHRISVALAFINDTVSSTHGNVRVDSVFISPSGEWKLGGFELLSSPKDDQAVLYTLGSVLPDSSTYSSPEVKKGGWSVLKEHNVAAADSYALGLLIHFSFNPSHPLPATAQPPHPPPAASSRGSIPTSIFPAYKKLLNPNPKARLTAKTFLDLGMAETAGEGGFFAKNRLVKVCAGLDNFALGSEAEKASLLRNLKESASSLPPEFASFKVLPSLISALEFGGANAASIVPLVLQLGTNVPPQEYSSSVLTHLVKLFASPDRGTRMALLDHLPEYNDKLDKKTVVDKVWPNLQTGFMDTVPVIREATVKAIILLSDKLNERILNNDLLRHLAKMQADPEASIRTNTCILIGRLGPTLGYNTKRKVLVPAFSRALKDPFVHCRVAGLMALMATVDCFDIEELANRVIPNMAFTMTDKEKLVRDHAFKAMQLFVKKLEDHAATMPETAIPENEMPSLVLPTTTASGAPATLVNSAAGAAGALAGWAITSLGRKLAAADLQSTIAGTSAESAPSLDRSNSAPVPQSIPGGFTNGFGSTSPLPPLTSTLSSPSTNSLGSSTSKAKGMQLGANKVPANVTMSKMAAEWAEEAAAEAEASQSNPWGSDDLMDVNADQDDWSAFETAPAPVIGLEYDRAPTPPPQPSEDSWGDSLGDQEWGAKHTPASPKHNKMTTTSSLSSKPHKIERPTSAQSVSLSDVTSEPVHSRGTSPAPTHHMTNTHSMAGMSKEERAAEMARRKEERKQRIAALKEQKKAAAKS
ncbi:Catalytically Inactive Kinase-Related Protein [Abortiporus biennis]